MMEDLLQFDFHNLLPMSRTELLYELTDAHTQLANLHLRVGFLRAEEIREPKGYAKQERYDTEGKRDAYIEKKFLIARLLDALAG